MAIEQTLVIIKPDAMRREILGEVLNALSETRLKIVGSKTVKVSDELAEKHYASLCSKPYFQNSINYITGKLHGENRVMALVYEGENAVKVIRSVCGVTNPEEADPLSIRGKYGRVTTKNEFENIIHASGNPEEAEYEIKLWFKPEELTHLIYPTEKKKITIEELVWKASKQSLL